MPAGRTGPQPFMARRGSRCVVPLVLASGAGAAARISLGLSVLTGMIASTCLAVLFVPSFFVVLQGLEERLKGTRQPAPSTQPAPGE